MHRHDYNLPFKPQRTTIWVEVTPEGKFLYRHEPDGEAHEQILIPCRSTTFFIVFRLQNRPGAFATYPVQWSTLEDRHPIPRPPNMQVLRVDDVTVTVNMMNPGHLGSELKAHHFHLVVCLGGKYHTSPDPTILEQQTPPDPTQSNADRNSGSD